MNIGLAQINSVIGDFPGNVKRILAAYRECLDAGADLVITPELSLVGYPPRDLVFKSQFVPKCLQALDYLAGEIREVPLLVGYVDHHHPAHPGKPFRNAAAWLENGEIRHRVWKTLLPTYDVFDERRYFEPGDSCEPILWNGHRIGVTICEDIWTENYLQRPFYDRDPVEELTAKGIDLLLNLSASPFHLGKPLLRRAMIGGIARKAKVPVVYCNAVGANDQLVFDGHSLVTDANGRIATQLPGFSETCRVVDPFSTGGKRRAARLLRCRGTLPGPRARRPRLRHEMRILQRLPRPQRRDRLRAHRHHRRRRARPGKRPRPDDAQPLLVARQRGRLLRPREEPRHPLRRGAYQKRLRGGQGDHAARFRRQTRGRHRGKHAGPHPRPHAHGTLQQGKPPASNHRQQERTRRRLLHHLRRHVRRPGRHFRPAESPVYEVSRWINREREIIPWNTIDKPPSAELRPDQKDQDTLPPYEILDDILELYVENQLSSDEIISRGFEETTVRWVQRRVDLNEWKRHQAAPGLRVTSKAFGIGRRMPIVQRFVG